MTDKIVIFSTCETEKQSREIARGLLEKRLAACVNIVPGAHSIYHWQGKIEEASEFLLVIKSRRDLFPALRAELARLHSYEVPETIALPIVDGSPEYLSWLDRELQPVS